MQSRRVGRNAPVILSLLILLSFLASAKAETAAERTSLRLVTGPHYPPYAADYLPLKGLGPFIVRRLLEASGYEATVELRPWKRAYREALKNKYDVVLPYIETPERKDQFLFTEAVFTASTYAYVRADSEISASSLEGLAGLVYCNPLGFADSSALQTMRSKGQIARLSPANLKSCFQMLAAGRADFIKINHYVADYILHHIDLSADKIRALPFIVERISLHAMVPKTRQGAQALISEFNLTLSEMEKTGQIEAWTQSYLDAINAETGTGPE